MSGPVLGGAEFPHTMRLPMVGRLPHKLTELSLAQIQKLADEFDLGRIIQMDAPLSTQCNLTEPFRTGQGTFMLRARHGPEYGDRVDFLHHVMDDLRAGGFPAPEVMRTREKRGWILWGDRLVEVQRFMPHDLGIHRDWSRMNAAASTLGELHRLLQDLPKRRPVVPPDMRNDLSPQECFQLLNTVESRLSGWPDATPRRLQTALGAVASVRRVLPVLINNYERFIGGMPWTVVHGDFHPWNLLYRGDGVAGVVDYDFLQERERVFDVAYAMRSLLAHLSFPPGTRTPDYWSLPWWKVKLWLDHYEESTFLPLQDKELGYLPSELMRLQVVEIVAGGLQDDPLTPVLQAAEGLPLYEFIHNNALLFL